MRVILSYLLYITWRLLFLSSLDKEGQPIEPRMLLPILPLVLVNGFQGIGTGWSTAGPNFGVLEAT